MDNFILTYNVVSRKFPGVRVRAGILLVYNGSILLVKERSENIGPPKGLVDWGTDASVLDASLRELREETGITVTNKSGCICTDIYMYSRPYQKELIVYYTILINAKPRVHVRKREILGYTWVDMKQGLSGKFQCSEATKSLFRAIDNSDVCKVTIPLHFISHVVQSRAESCEKLTNENFCV